VNFESIYLESLFESIYKETSRERKSDLEESTEVVDYPEGIELPQRKVVKFRDKQVEYFYPDGTSVSEWLNL
jgi:hypothetical protein